MRYTLIKSLVIFNYFSDSQNLDIIFNYKVLDTLFDSKLNFSNHTEMIKYKVMGFLGFIKRTCKSFYNLLVLKILYCSLVWSNLEYCSLI